MTRPPRVRFAAEGIEVEGGLLWLDATEPKEFGVITHAHGDHVGRHRRILCTPATAEFVRKRAGHGAEYWERPYGVPTAVGDLTVTLLPAGHILGSAQVLLEGPGGRLFYTGDVRPEGGLTCPKAEFARADVLVTEATFGTPEFRLPPPERTRAELVAFAREALAEDATPVFLVYSLGKGQEVLAALTRADVPTGVHGAIWNLCGIYRRHGLSFPGARRLGRRPGRKEAVLVPPRYLETAPVQAYPERRVAAVTGWGARARDRNFPLSDHADYDGLVKVVTEVSPRKVFVLHGYAREFAEDLRRRGYDAEAVAGHSGPEEGERPGMFGAPYGHRRKENVDGDAAD